MESRLGCEANLTSDKDLMLFMCCIFLIKSPYLQYFLT